MTSSDDGGDRNGTAPADTTFQVTGQYIHRDGMLAGMFTSPANGEAFATLLSSVQIRTDRMLALATDLADAVAAWLESEGDPELATAVSEALRAWEDEFGV